MNRDDLIKNNQINTQALIEFGFKKDNEIFTYKKNLDNPNFYTVIQITDHHFDITVFDKDFDEVYMPFEIKNARGKFVSAMRDEIDALIEMIQSKCLEPIHLKDEVVQYIFDKYHVVPDYPWGQSPTHGTFKHNQSQKWFALIMKLPFEKLDIHFNGNVDVINLKLKPEHIENLIDRVHFFPAYHMNKQYWISVVLDKNMPIKTICELIDESHSLVE